MEATATATARDFADVEDDGAIRESIERAKPKAKLPSGFSHKGNRLCFDDGGDSGPHPIAGRIEVEAQTRDDLGNNWGLLIAWKDDEQRRHQWAMARSLLAGDGTEIRATLLDQGCWVGPGAKSRNALMVFLGTATSPNTARAVTRMGWTDGAFALPDRSIGDTEDRRLIYQGPAALDHKYRERGGLAEWRNAVARYGVGNSRLAVALSSAFVGPLLGLIGEEGGGINLRGPSSIGKTTALVAAASVWGPPDYVGQWRATSNGLEGTAAQHSETLLVLDEMGQLDPKEAGSVAYMLANGAGKARARRDGGLRAPATWRVFFLSSGEISLADLAGRDGRGARRSAAGQEVRILDVEADAGRGFGLFDTIHDAPNAETLSRMVKDGAAEAHGFAGPAFVTAIASKQDAVALALRKGVAGFVNANLPPDASGQVARAARRFGIIATAGELAARAGVLPWPAGEATAAATVMFNAWIAARGGSHNAEDEEAIARVRGFLQIHGAARFEPMDRSSYDAAPRIINRAGFSEMVEGLRQHLILTEVWRNEVCAGVDPKRVAAVLAAKGMLLVDAKGKNSVSRTLPDLGKSRVYAVTPAIFGGDSDG